MEESFRILAVEDWLYEGVASEKAQIIVRGAGGGSTVARGRYIYPSVIGFSSAAQEQPPP